MNPQALQPVEIIDSHTGGEPTRVVISGGPDLGSGTMAERLALFREKHDDFRSAVIKEPRGSDVIVGALLCEPVNPRSAAGVIFFNNVGYLGMCGHGAIGLIVTLAFEGRITPGEHVLETPAGDVRAVLHDSGEVTIENVPSFRTARQVELEVEGHGPVRGDVAWGGNWFFLVGDHGQEIHVAQRRSPHRLHLAYPPGARPRRNPGRRRPRGRPRRTVRPARAPGR